MIHTGDALAVLKTLESESVQCCVTSPPYWGLRDYGVDGQLGLEKTPELYVERIVEIFHEVRRALRDDGTLWLNLGDSYAAGAQTTGRNDAVRQGVKTGGDFGGGPRTSVGASGLKPKDLVGIPWRVAFALQADGWYLRSDIIWHKPNPMPESVTDRPTKAHEYVFLLSKSKAYFYDQEAIAEDATSDRNVFSGDTGGGKGPDSTRSDHGRRDDKTPTARNARSVWTIATKPYSQAHFATFPPELAERCIKAGSACGNTVLDPFFGAGTVGLMAEALKREWVGIELNPEYVEMARQRIGGPLFAGMVPTE